MSWDIIGETGSSYSKDILIQSIVATFDRDMTDTPTSGFIHIRSGINKEGFPYSDAVISGSDNEVVTFTVSVTFANDYNSPSDVIILAVADWDHPFLLALEPVMRCIKMAIDERRYAAFGDATGTENLNGGNFYSFSTWDSYVAAELSLQDYTGFIATASKMLACLIQEFADHTQANADLVSGGFTSFSGFATIPVWSMESLLEDVYVVNPPTVLMFGAIIGIPDTFASYPTLGDVAAWVTETYEVINRLLWVKMPRFAGRMYRLGDNANGLRKNVTAQSSWAAVISNWPAIWTDPGTGFEPILSTAENNGSGYQAQKWITDFGYDTVAEARHDATHDADFYIRPVGTFLDVFDAGGFGFIEDKYNRIISNSSETGPEVEFNLIPWIGDGVPDLEPGINESRGWFTLSGQFEKPPVAVLRFNIEDGFDYVE